MKETKNYKLRKPEDTDFCSVEDISDNAEKVDTVLGELQSALDKKPDSPEGGFATKTELSEHIEDADKHVTSEERAEWNNKASKSHTHTESDITGLDGKYLPLAGGTMTGPITKSSTTSNDVFFDFSNDIATKYIFQSTPAYITLAAQLKANSKFYSALNVGTGAIQIEKHVASGESAIIMQDFIRLTATGGVSVENVVTPTNDTDAANKKYVDDATSGVADIAEYNKYWWERSTPKTEYTILTQSMSASTQYIVASGYCSKGGSTKMLVGNNVGMRNGELVLTDETTITVTYSQITGGVSTGYTYFKCDGKIYKGEATYSTANSNGQFAKASYYSVCEEIIKRPFTMYTNKVYVTSANVSEYPKNGILGNYHYYFIGNPLKRTPEIHGATKLFEFNNSVQADTLLSIQTADEISAYSMLFLSVNARKGSAKFTLCNEDGVTSNISFLLYSGNSSEAYRRGVFLFFKLENAWFCISTLEGYFNSGVNAVNVESLFLQGSKMNFVVSEGNAETLEMCLFGVR